MQLPVSREMSAFVPSERQALQGSSSNSVFECSWFDAWINYLNAEFDVTVWELNEAWNEACNLGSKYNLFMNLMITFRQCMTVTLVRQDSEVGFYEQSRNVSLTVSEGALVGKAAAYCLSDRISIHGRGKWFLFSTTCRPSLGPNQLSIQWVLGRFPRKKLPGVKLTTQSIWWYKEWRNCWIYFPVPFIFESATKFKLSFFLTENKQKLDYENRYI